MKNDLIPEINISDLPQKLQEVAHKNGIEDAVLLLKKMPGLRLYIPSYGNKKEEYELFKKTFNGKNNLSVLAKLKITLNRFQYLAKGRFKYNKNKSFYSNKYMKLVVDRCGYDVAKRLIKNFSGEFIYIPISGFNMINKRKILEEFNGTNSTYLALKYHVSERFINLIISEKHSSAIQLDLFEKQA